MSLLVDVTGFPRTSSLTEARGSFFIILIIKIMARKNKYGQYFTISLIADFMVTLISHERNCRVLEPSCGKGVFLDFLKKYGYTDIVAYEIDKTLDIKHNFVQNVSFLSVPLEEKFDVVIGNPPYIRWKNIEPELKSELEHNELWNNYFNSLCDYLFIFILKSIVHLKDGGELIFICTEYWMNTTHSATLRNFMCQNGYFSEIYHFKETPLFEKVTASFVIFRYIKSKAAKNSINLYRYNKEKGLPSSEELENRSCFDMLTIPHFQENSRWILATKDVQEKMAKFEGKCIKPSRNLFDTELYRIGDFCDIGNGMVSGLDAAFQIKDTMSLNTDEKSALIDVYKAKDLCPYKNKSKSQYIFMQEDITKEDFKAKYPHFEEHFRPYMERLSNRYSYGKDIPYWKFVFPRNQKLFERKEDRIFIPCKERISHKHFFRFCYARQGVYPTQDVTAIFKKVRTKESIEYILAYLNNERVFDWLVLNGIVKGAIVEFSEAPIASIPFRPINWNSEVEVRLHDRITNEVRQYLSTSSIRNIENINVLFNIMFNE